MTIIAQRRALSAIVGAAGLSLLAACAGNQGAQAISTESGNTSASSTWEGSGSSSSSSSSSSKPAKARNQLAEFRGNPTPELDTLSERNDDIINRSVVVSDTNLRMLREDWGRLWFWERPSRLSPTTIPH